MMCTGCLVCFISTVNGRSKKEEKKVIKDCASSGHITNLKQFIQRLLISMTKTHQPVASFAVVNAATDHT